jgi:hypothetical protein
LAAFSLAPTPLANFKLSVSSRELESQRVETLKTLDGFLEGLGYLEVQS